MSKSFHVVCPRCDAVNRVPQDRPASQAVCGRCKAKLFEGHPIELAALVSSATPSAATFR